MLGFYFASILAAAALRGTNAHKHDRDHESPDGRTASRGAELSKMWPHNHVEGMAAHHLECDVTCNDKDIDVDLEAKSWPKRECFGSFVAKCSGEHKGKSTKVTTKCNGVFMFEKQAPAESFIDGNEPIDAIRRVADAMLAEQSALADDDKPEEGFTFSGCEGELMATAVVSKSGDDAVDDSSSISSSRRLQKHGHGGKHGHGPGAMFALCVGRSRAVASNTTAESSEVGDSGDKHSARMVFNCEHDLVLGTVHGLDQAAEHGPDHSVQHELDRIQAHARGEVARGAAHPPPPPPPGSKESMDVDLALASQESAHLVWDAPSCSDTDAATSGKRPQCTAKCNGHKGLRWFGLWPCTGEFEVAHSASGHSDHGGCYKADVSAKCFGRTWPFWKDCEGTFLLDESVTKSRTKGDDQCSMHAKTFHVGVGKTVLIEHHHGPVKVRGMHARGHTTIHSHATFSHSNTTAFEPEPLAEQLRIEE